MAEKNMIEQLLNQITELMEIAHENKDHTLEGDLPPQLEKELEALERDVQEFCDLNEQLIVEAGVSEQGCNPKSQRVLQKARKLRQELESTQRGLTTAVQIVKKQEKTFGKKGDKASKKVARTKKFKRIGGKKGWMPL